MDTRQDPHNRPDLKDAPDEFAQSDTITEDHDYQIDELVQMHHSLEAYQRHLDQAGVDGLTPAAKQALLIGLNQIDSRLVGREISFEEHVDTSEKSVGDRIKEIVKKIYQYVLSLIEKAKQIGKQVLAGVDKVKSKSEELLEQLKQRTRSGPSTELHNEPGKVSVQNPVMLFAGNDFCLAECRTEQEVIKFFVKTYPQYTKDQIGKLTRVIDSYDVESGNLDQYESVADFIGKHISIVNGITAKVIPGNKHVAFRYTALGPYLEDADVKEPPVEYSFTARPRNEIENTIKANIATMNALSELFKAEANILDDMKDLGQSLLKLQDRRGETVWKSARDSLDKVCNDSMELFQKMRPDYGPIVAHLTRVGKARNDVCELELNALQ